MNDPIADMLNRIRNSQAVLAETVLIPYSNIKYEIARILEKSGFVKKVDKKGRKERFLEIFLKYHTDELNRQEKTSAISGLRRISKTGKRIYRPANDIKMTKGRGIVIVSTSSGIMTGVEAKKKNLGGEVICEVW
jgi:small subunit ribosomal protein S8